MAEAKELGGKVALVTGASSGLGREFALSFAKWGCNVVVTARRTELLESLCQEIDQLPGPGKAAAVPLDVSGTHDQIDAAIERAWKHFGRIDVLINNAGFRAHLHRAYERGWKSQKVSSLVVLLLEAGQILSY
eukprot:Gb_35110 [translate_table: standard]